MVKKKEQKKAVKFGIKGENLAGAGKIDEAIQSFLQAIDVDSQYADAHYNLGVLLRMKGMFPEAAASYQRTIDLQPDYFNAHYNLGNMLKELGILEDSVACYQNAIAIKPDMVAAHNNLGAAFNELGKLQDAAECYQNAIAHDPEHAEAYCNLATVQSELGRHEEAIENYHKALASNPRMADAHNNLGAVLNRLGRLDDAVESYQKALAINPNSAESLSNLGTTLKGLSQLDESVECFNKAIAIKPDFAECHSSLLLTEQYRSGHTAESLYKLHCKWDEQHGVAHRENWPQHQNTPDPERRLRIGFVSSDLGFHPVGIFVVRLFENLPDIEIETVAYSDRQGDAMTKRIKASTGTWHDVKGVSDEQLTTKILDDKIDILFDLAGHSANNKLLVFARKPAPVQVTWAGYVGTTGLSAIDYLLSDSYSTRKEDEKYCSEKVIRMLDDWVPYDPPGHAPEVGPSPFKRNGYVTFCSFNNLAKINDDVLSAWIKILQSVEDSRLLMKYKGMDSVINIERTTKLFRAKGIDPSRLLFEGVSPHVELLGRYNDADIALDTFPYSGGLTTYEALWMGVPVITFPGQTFASRHSQVHLSTAGFPELVAHDKDNYVKLAVELANDPDRLAALRSGMRDKVAASPVCDGKKFADGFTSNMRTIWRHWCKSKN